MPEKPRSDPARWGDLTTRVLSGLAVAALGLAAIWAGGVWFEMLAAGLVGLMIWELWAMFDGERRDIAVVAGVLAATLFAGQIRIDTGAGMGLFLVVAILGILLARKGGTIFGLYALAIQLAAWGLVAFRAELGLPWVLWLVAIVAISDIFGYVAGRMIGGPKFWPRVSPKKTWSGTIAGWIGAAGLGLVAMIAMDVGPWLVLLSVLTCLAGQMGDIAESALKRWAGVKDSSTLIPGHGGVLDRFDALMGAALFLLAVTVTFRIAGITP